MKGKTFLLSLLLFVLFLSGCNRDSISPGKEAPSKEEAEASGVIRLVETFGQRLQEVFLLAPQEELKTAMEKFYGDLVDPTLFAVWVEDPLGAPGYLKSTSTPERIDEIQAKRQSDGSYEIQGILIETDQGQEVNRLIIRLVVSPLEQGWRITQVSLNPDEALPPAGYSNTHYGFTLSLPISWTGYQVIETQWEGFSLQKDDLIEKGPQFLFRHPLWHQDAPRQDIPILVFSLAQWTSLEKESFRLGAAPVGPRELARNDHYIFVLPARFNFAFLQRLPQSWIKETWRPFRL